MLVEPWLFILVEGDQGVWTGMRWRMSNMYVLSLHMRKEVHTGLLCAHRITEYECRISQAGYVIEKEE